MFRTMVPAALLIHSACCFAGAAPDASQAAVPVLVTTELGAPVTNLTKENFRLFEDRTEQRIASLTVEHGPVSFGVLVDTSGSMQGRLEAIAHGVASLLSDDVRGDEAFLLEFAATAQVTVPFTGDSEKIIQQTLHAQPQGRTCLLDAIDLALRHLQHARNLRRAIVVFSDGGDNASRMTESDVRKSLADSEVQLFAIGFFNPPSGRLRSPEEYGGPHVLEKLTKETGGELYWPERPNALTRLGLLVATEMHTRYVLSYCPAPTLVGGKHHRIRIALTPPQGQGKLVASYRQTAP
jgi:Ca-activated chloride channel family protein